MPELEAEGMSKEITDELPKAIGLCVPKFMMTTNEFAERKEASAEIKPQNEYRFKVVITGTVTVENKKAIHAAVERMFDGIAATIQKISIKNV